MRQNSAQLIADFVAVAALAGHTIRAEDIRHEFVPAPHARPQLPRGTSAVYVFSLASDESVVLKVGKVGPKSAARFGSQHYLPASAKSNLAKSVLGPRAKSRRAEPIDRRRKLSLANCYFRSSFLRISRPATILRSAIWSFFSSTSTP